MSSRQCLGAHHRCGIGPRQHSTTPPAPEVAGTSTAPLTRPDASRPRASSTSPLPPTHHSSSSQPSNPWAHFVARQHFCPPPSPRRRHLASSCPFRLSLPSARQSHHQFKPSGCQPSPSSTITRSSRHQQLPSAEPALATWSIDPCWSSTVGSLQQLPVRECVRERAAVERAIEACPSLRQLPLPRPLPSPAARPWSGSNDLLSTFSATSEHGCLTRFAPRLRIFVIRSRRGVNIELSRCVKTPSPLHRWPSRLTSLPKYPTAPTGSTCRRQPTYLAD